MVITDGLLLEPDVILIKDKVFFRTEAVIGNLHDIFPGLDPRVPDQGKRKREQGKRYNLTFFTDFTPNVGF